jgi:hypothetical protein
VTVPVRRGGLIFLLAPMERREACAVVETVPEGDFLLYGIGVSLLGMRSSATARARVPVGE